MTRDQDSKLQPVKHSALGADTEQRILREVADRPGIVKITRVMGAKPPQDILTDLQFKDDPRHRPSSAHPTRDTGYSAQRRKPSAWRLATGDC